MGDFNWTPEDFDRMRRAQRYVAALASEDPRSDSGKHLSEIAGGWLPFITHGADKARAVSRRSARRLL